MSSVYYPPLWIQTLSIYSNNSTQRINTVATYPNVKKITWEKEEKKTCLRTVRTCSPIWFKTAMWKHSLSQRRVHPVRSWSVRHNTAASVYRPPEVAVYRRPWRKMECYLLCAKVTANTTVQKKQENVGGRWSCACSSGYEATVDDMSTNMVLT